MRRVIWCGLFSFFMCAGTLLQALPGIESLLPDTSGEYVVYRDYTFPEETYIGFLFYDDETYGAFVMTPSEGKNVAVLVSVNAASDHIDITGERIISDILPGDTASVNYIHDMLYELGARRKAAGGQDFSATVRRSEDFPQFGGDVTMVYDYYVPLFGLTAILDAGGNSVLDLVRMGQIEADNDTEFYRFIPFPRPLNAAVHEFTPDPKALPEIYELDGQTLQLDSQWMMSAENVWFLGDTAMFWVDSILVNPEFQTRNEYLPQEYFMRRFSLSGPGRHADISAMSIEKLPGGVFRLENVFYNPQTNEATRDIKVFIPGDNDTVTTKNLTVFESVYQEHKIYFDSIVGR